MIRLKRTAIALAVLVAGVWLGTKGYGGALVLALLAAYFIAPRSGTARPASAARVARTATTHNMIVCSHGGYGTPVAAKHEAGHVRMAQRIGARVHAAQVNEDGSGWTRLDLPRNASPVEQIAVAVAGEVASGTSRGCYTDQKYVRAVLAELPSSERGKAKRAGYALARQTVGGWIFDGGVSSTAAQLRKKGHVRF